MVALRMLLWRVEHCAAGAGADRAVGAEGRAARLWGLLDANGVDLDYLKFATAQQRLLLYSKLGVPPVERVWLAGLLRNRPCGALVLSSDGKHVCLRQGLAALGWRCGAPGHEQGAGATLQQLRAARKAAARSRSGRTPADAAAAEAARRGPPPIGTCTRDELRRYYGPSLWPLYEPHEEEGIDRRLKQHFGPEADADTAGHLVELSELLRLRTEARYDWGADPDTVGGKEDSAAVASVWAHCLDETPEELAQAVDARESEPVRDPMRAFDIILLRCEFDQGRSYAEYQSRVEQRREEWAGWLARLQSALHRCLELYCTPNSTVQALAPPSLARMQSAADAAEPGLAALGQVAPAQDTAAQPPPPRTAHLRLFRPVAAERAVDPRDALPCMPTLVLTAGVAPARRRRGRPDGGAALSFSLRVHREACFRRGSRFTREAAAAVARLGSPPAMVGFSAVFRVDPRQVTEYLEQLHDTGSAPPPPGWPAEGAGVAELAALEHSWTAPAEVAAD